MSKRILFYYPPNSRSVAIETICKIIVDAGHKLFLLTLTKKGPLHTQLEQMGVTTYSFYIDRKPSREFFWNHFLFFIRVCKKNKIDIVLSQLATANLIAVFGQYFVKARVLVFRHHDESSFYAQYGKQFGMARQKMEILSDRIINRLAKKIVVLSPQVRETMKRYEHCSEKKIIVCPLIYDFNRYPIPDQNVVDAIKTKMDCKLLMIMVSRMIESKQHRLAFEVMQKLITEGLSIKMLVMDQGPLQTQLEKYVIENNLSDYIQFTGFRSDFINYMAASDLLVHPSLTEASNNVTKEMALLNKAVAVCNGVGDFDDYIKAGYSGYILYRQNLAASLESAIRAAYDNPNTREYYGKNLHTEMLRLFSDTPENRKRFLQLI